MPTQAPPDIPSNVPPQVADYLRRLNAWAFQEIDKKLGKAEPQQQILMYPVTQKKPTIVWALVVNDTGTTAVQRVPFGGANPP